MAQEPVLEKLREVLPDLMALGVKDISLFGSYARGDASPESDIDILVSLASPDYALYCRVLDFLESALGQKVDLVMVEALKDAYRDKVLSEAVRVA